ncbi:hypothetical protein K439DRAFT_877557 [Ramaria rubella]|nr:hypothetical protein K439DRAFT_877557 [Ramaria rubella]
MEIHYRKHCRSSKLYHGLDSTITGDGHTHLKSLYTPLSSCALLGMGSSTLVLSFSCRSRAHRPQFCFLGCLAPLVCDDRVCSSLVLLGVAWAASARWMGVDRSHAAGEEQNLKTRRPQYTRVNRSVTLDHT